MLIFSAMAAADYDRIAKALAHIAAGWRDRDDLEALARLPDGSIEIDILSGTARHASAGPMALRLAEELRSALRQRLARHGVDPGSMEEARLDSRMDTGALKTDRARIVHFDFHLEIRLRAEGHEYRAARREDHVWHARDPG